MGSVEERSLKRLRMAGGLEADAADGYLKIGVAGSRPIRMRVERKARLSERELELLLPSLEQDHSTVLLTRRLVQRHRERLKRLGISWIESETGVVHLRAPGLAIDLPEDPALSSDDDRTASLPRLDGKAGVVVEVVLEEALRKPLIEQPAVAELAGATQPWASRIFTALVRADALEQVGAGPNKRWRPIMDRLLEIWEAGGAVPPDATPLYAWSRTPRDLLERLADQTDIPYAVGGVAAADLQAPTLSAPTDPDIWIPAAVPPAALAEVLEGEVVDTGGNATAWQASGDPSLKRAAPLSSSRNETTHPLAELRIVSPVRALAEAAQGRGRGREVADRLRNEILARRRKVEDERS